MTELSVLIPTTGRRPEMLHTVRSAIESQLPAAEILTVEGFSWGEGLNLLAMVAKGTYLSCCCDDTVPVAGWFDAARAMLDEGYEPCSQYLNVDGSPLRPGTDDQPHGTPLPWARSFLLTQEMFREVGPFIDATWYTDIDYSERLLKAGYEIRACTGFSFTHLNGDRDWQSPEVDAQEREQYAASHARQGIVPFT